MAASSPAAPIILFFWVAAEIQNAGLFRGMESVFLRPEALTGKE